MPSHRQEKIKSSSILYTILFILFCTIGILLASQKPLWTDEVHTQKGAVAKNSYSAIITGKIVGEGNKSPLFYIVQKLSLDILGYETTSLDKKSVSEQKKNRVLLRLWPIIYIALFLVLLLRFFTTRFNIYFGLFSLVLALTSPMLWIYWPEARPYGLWVLLTSLQMVVSIDLLEKKVFTQKDLLSLFVIHMALCLTCALSIFQCLIVSAFTLFKFRDIVKSLLLAIPICFIFYFRPENSASTVIFSLTIPQMFRDCVAKDRLFILGLYPLLSIVYCINKFIKPEKQLISDKFIHTWPFFVASFLMFLSTYFFLTFLHQRADNVGQYVHSRHIIFLLPVGIITISYLVGICWETIQATWLKTIFIISVFLFFIYRLPPALANIKNTIFLIN